MGRGRPHLERLCVSAVNSSRQLELLDLAGAAAYEAGIDRKANQARIMARGRPDPRRCMRNGGRRRMLFNSRLAAGGIVSPCVVELAALVAVLSGMGRADRIGSVCVVSAELTRLKVMAPQARIRGAVVRAFTTHAAAGLVDGEAGCPEPIARVCGAPSCRATRSS